MVASLNPDYELVYVDKETDKVYLKNSFFNNLVSLSSIEYEIIQFYSQNPDPQKVFRHFSSEYEMPSDFIYRLVQKAEASGVLLNDGYTEHKEKIIATSGKRIDNYLFYWVIVKIQTFFNLLGLNTQLELKGSFKYYLILSFDLKNTWLDKINSHRSIQLVVIALYGVSVAAVIMGFTQIDNFRPVWDYNLIGKSQGALPLLVLFLGIVIVTIFHELGHYLLYKLFGGVKSQMGLALMTGIIPTFYVSTSSLPLWKHQYQRILVMVGGTLVDVLFLFLFVYLGYAAKSGIISYYAFIFSFMQAYRIYFNMNPFIPRTDGYFIMCDWLDNSTFHSTSYSHAMDSFEKLKGFQLSTITGKELGYTLYFFLSFVFMILNYLMFLLPFTFLFI